MKKKILIASLLSVSLLAKQQQVSPIPLPMLYIQDMSAFECTQKCLIDFANKKQIFSFLANTQTELDSELELTNINYNKLIAIYSNELKHEPTSQKSKIKIALLLPYKTIGKYASTTTNATLAYLMLKNYPFELETYKVEDESETSIKTALDSIKRDGFNYIIAPLTKLGEASLGDVSGKTFIYIPTINKKDATQNSANVFYGGIDYKAQSDKLLEYANSKLYIFSDNSRVAQEISNYQQLHYTKGVAKIFALPQNVVNLDSIIQKSWGANGGSVFINTPIVKSAMVLSQLTLHDIKAENILSIQTNYTPLLFSMTQYNDRKNIILANSIVKNSNNLSEINSLLDNDIDYDWINYTTSVGIDYFAHLAYGEVRDFDIDIVSNGMSYPVELLQPSMDRFKTLD